jgi:hypothetical protein
MTSDELQKFGLAERHGKAGLPSATHGGFLIPQKWQIQSNHVNSTVHSSYESKEALWVTSSTAPKV